MGVSGGDAGGEKSGVVEMGVVSRRGGGAGGQDVLIVLYSPYSCLFTSIYSSLVLEESEHESCGLLADFKLGPAPL